MVEYQITCSVLLLSGFNKCPERVRVGVFLSVLVCFLGLCGGGFFSLFLGGCFLWLTADEPLLAFVWLGFAFWAGTSRKRDMDEVEKCSDVAVCSD